MWPYGLAGAAAVLGVLVLSRWGEDACGDAVVVLGVPAPLVGALVGAWLGGLVVGRGR